MILFENPLIKLNYNPATDILEVAYPDLHGHLLPEIKHAVSILVDHVKNYDIKKLLLDSSRTLVSVSQEETREITLHLISGLKQTRLQKLARLQSPSAQVENMAANNIAAAQQAGLLTFELQHFTNKSDAVEWLQS